MKTFIVVLASTLLFFGIFVLTAVSSLNTEASLRASINAHEKAREASLDTMKKIILQKAQLPAAAKKDLIDLLPQIVSGREGGSVFKSVQEKYPDFTLPLYLEISRSIEAERHVFLRKQEELFDVKREHDALLGSVFGGTICRMFGRFPIDVNVISSTETKEIIRSGIDDDIDLKLNK